MAVPESGVHRYTPNSGKNYFWENDYYLLLSAGFWDVPLFQTKYIKNYQHILQIRQIRRHFSFCRSKIGPFAGLQTDLSSEGTCSGPAIAVPLIQVHQIIHIQ